MRVIIDITEETYDALRHNFVPGIRLADSNDADGLLIADTPIRLLDAEKVKWLIGDLDKYGFTKACIDAMPAVVELKPDQN